MRNCRNWQTSLRCAALVLGAVTGCTEQPARSPSALTPAGPEHGHSHERGKMLIADVGDRYHALLTAHLSRMGNELDVYFELQDDKNATPAALPFLAFTAHVKVAGTDQAKDLQFEAAPADERPKGEKPGTCSHFVAKAPWLQPADKLTVVALLVIDGERYRVTWNNFDPKKYAHHED